MVADSKTLQRNVSLAEAHGRIGPVVSFSISSIAPSLAVLFTNPFDTAKVRLQLQGQQITASRPEQLYRNSLDCMVKTFKIEGLRGLQKGLVPAICRESSKNLFRLGLYVPILQKVHDKDSNPPVWKMFVAGSISGAVGAIACNPFELVKTRLQASAKGELSKIGHQHGYLTVRNALASIVVVDGIFGLYRGVLLSVVRSMLGSGTNLAFYNTGRDFAINQGHIKDGPLPDVVAGMISGLASVIAMNPVDVIRTRYYNTPKTEKRSLVSLATSMIKKEGPKAFYKGFSAHFARIGPHFGLTFMFLGILRRGADQAMENKF